MTPSRRAHGRVQGPRAQLELIDVQQVEDGVGHDGTGRQLGHPPGGNAGQPGPFGLAHGRQPFG